LWAAEVAVALEAEAVALVIAAKLCGGEEAGD